MSRARSKIGVNASERLPFLPVHFDLKRIRKKKSFLHFFKVLT